MSGSTWTWVGGTSAAWGNPGNWSPESVPTSGGTIDINGGSAPNVPTLTGTELSDNTINLSNGAVIDFTNGATLDGLSTVTGALGTINVSGVFTDYGNIQATSGQTLAVSMAAGSTLISNGPDYTGPGTDVGINNGFAGYFNGGTLYVLGGTLDNQEVHVNGGYVEVTSALESNDEFSVDGGTLEIGQSSTVSPSQITFINADTATPSTLKFDSPSLFDGDGAGTIYAFTTGDTIDIGAATVGTIVFNANAGINGGIMIVENTAGNPLFSAQLSGGDAGTFAAGSYALNGTVAGSFQVVTGTNGDTLISEATSPGTTTPPPGPTTFSWIGGTGSYDIASNWTIIAGTSTVGYPVNGDSALVPSGTMEISGAALDLANLNVGGASGGGVALTDSASLEVSSGLSMLGASVLSVDGSSGVDLGSSGTYVAGAVAIEANTSLVANGLIAAAVVDDGTLVADPGAATGGTLEISGTVSGSGGITLASGSTLKLDATVENGPSIAFAGGTAETLVLGSPGTAFSNGISGLAYGDKIEFGNGMTISGASVVNGNTIALDFSSGTSSGVYDLTNASFADGLSPYFAAGIDASTGDSYIQVGPAISAPNDFNGDGTSDLLVTDGSGDIVTWSIQNGTLSGSPTYFATATDGWSYLATGNFYGHGSTDILVTDGSGDLVDWKSQNGTLSGSPTYIGSTTDGWHYAGTGDFTGNGTSDILVEDGSGDLAYWPITDGTLSGSPVYVGTATDGWRFLATADLHGTGTSDILLTDGSGDITDWFMQNGAMSGSPTYVGTAMDGWSFLGTGDFTGNGTDDLLLTDASGDLAYWPIKNGTLNGSPSYIGTATDGWSYLATGDFYGNGTSDIAVQNTTSGAVAIWKISDGALSGSPTNVGSTIDGWHAIAGT